MIFHLFRFDKRIGEINFDDMTFSLLRVLSKEGIKVILVPTNVMNISNEALAHVKAKEEQKKREDSARMTAILRHVEDLSELNCKKSKSNRLLVSLLLVSLAINVYAAMNGWNLL